MADRTLMYLYETRSVIVIIHVIPIDSSCKIMYILKNSELLNIICRVCYQKCTTHVYDCVLFILLRLNYSIVVCLFAMFLCVSLL